MYICQNNRHFQFANISLSNFLLPPSVLVSTQLFSSLGCTFNYSTVAICLTYKYLYAHKRTFIVFQTPIYVSLNCFMPLISIT